MGSSMTELSRQLSVTEDLKLLNYAAHEEQKVKIHLKGAERIRPERSAENQRENSGSSR